jgi:hypothetical protein
LFVIAVTQKKKTVFDRLGDGSVTSTTESEGPSITITGLGLNIVKPASSMPEKVICSCQIFPFIILIICFDIAVKKVQYLHTSSSSSLEGL